MIYYYTYYIVIVINHSIYPDHSKLSRVKPMFQQGEASIYSNHRPHFNSQHFTKNVYSVYDVFIQL